LRRIRGGRKRLKIRKGKEEITNTERELEKKKQTNIKEIGA